MTPDKLDHLRDVLADAMPAPAAADAAVEALADAAGVAELARVAGQVAASAAVHGRDAAFVARRLAPVLDALASRAEALRENLERQWRRAGGA